MRRPTAGQRMECSTPKASTVTPAIDVGSRSAISCVSSRSKSAIRSSVVAVAWTGQGAPPFRPKAWSGCAWVSMIASGARSRSRSRQSAPQSIIRRLPSRWIIAALWRRCPRLATSRFALVPRKVRRIATAPRAAERRAGLRRAECAAAVSGPEPDRLAQRPLLPERLADPLVLLLHLGRHRGAALLQRGLELLASHAGETAAQRREAGPARHVLKIRAGVSLGPRGDVVEVDVLGQGHRAGVDAEDVSAGLGVRDRHVDQLVEASGPQERRIH